MNVDGKTELIGLIGWPVAHSFSPAMHNAAADALGLNSVYVPLPVHPQNLETAVQGLPALGFKGVNVTVPHKQTIMPFLDSIEPGADLIGAVNTVVVKRERDASWQLEGHNTDWLGFLADLKSLSVDINGRDCLILGAGGSARAVVYGLAKAGIKIHLLARRAAQAEALAADFSSVADMRVDALSSLSSLVDNLEAPLIVNATPLGMSPDVESSIWPDDVPFPDDSVVYDLVYNPLETQLMRQAKAAGCQASNGLGMLIHQGALAFELWMGQKPNKQVMKEALQLTQE